LRRRTHPGLPERWDDPPLVDLRALAFARPTHRPSCPKARRAMPMFGSGRRLPGSAAFGAIAGRPETVPLRAGLVGEPTSVPEAGSCSGCPDQHPGAVHADPVARVLARWRLRTDGSTGAVGVPPWLRPVLRCPWPPAEAGNSVHRSCSSARRPGCPVLVASERGFTPRPESPPPREPEPFSPSLGPKASLGRLGHPVPVGVRSPVRRIHSRMHNPRSRGIFQSPGLSPNFFFNPQKFFGRPPFVHRDVPRSTTSSVGFR